MLWVAPGLMAQADLSITKSDDVDPVGPGDNVVYTVLVTNAGPASADVDFADQLPLGLGFISLSSTQGALSESGGLITGSLGTLSSGEIASVEITTVVNLLARGVLTNQAAVDSVTPDPVTADNLVSETTTILASADISLDKAVSPPPHVAGTQFDYFLNATNNGPDISTGSFISDILPAGITFVSATTQQGIVSHENNEILATIGNGAVGAQVQVVVTCLIDPGIQAGTVLSNNATAEANEFDGNSVNNSRSESITVSTSADLGITKSDSDDPAISGRTLTYTVVVTNAGPSVADNVVITDVLPVEVTFATAEITAGTVMEAGGTVTGNITQMLVGEIATLEIQATIGSLVSGTITNSADVTSDDPDPNGANDALR
jgi:uncharacterized repeat protein (TIGR01451 family)